MKPATFFLGGISVPLCCGPTPWAMTRLHAQGGPGTSSVVRISSALSSRVGDEPRRSDLGDLVERQLDRGLPAEDRDQHLELLALGDDLGDGGREGLERTLHDGDRLADLELHLRG